MEIKFAEGEKKIVESVDKTQVSLVISIKESEILAKDLSPT